MKKQPRAAVRRYSLPPQLAAGNFKTSVIAIAFLLLLVGHAPTLHAYTHEKLPVNFLKHSERSFELARKNNKPLFLLISAAWCQWCKIFEEKTLAKKEVYSYLNDNFVNIFIDAEARRDLYLKYQASTLPYVLFLAPDGSLLQKYGGVLYADDFLELIKIINQEASLNAERKNTASGSTDIP